MRTKIIPVLFLTAATVLIAATAISWMQPAEGAKTSATSAKTAATGPEPSPAIGNGSSTATVAGPSAADIRLSVSKSLSILQSSGYKFTERAKLHCASCHHNTMTSMLEEKSKLKGIAVVDTFKIQRIRSMVGDIRFACNINQPDIFVPAKFIAPYVLLGLAAEKYQPDPYTDIAVDYIINQQKPDGTFGAEFGRPPLESGEMHLASICVRAIQLYAAPAQDKNVGKIVSRTKHWLENTAIDVPQEMNFQLLGLQWCGSSRQEKEKVAARILALQHPDGSWSQLPTMTSDAYATGQALYALSESNTIQPQDPAYQKGVSWLLKHQDESGAWIVETRAFSIQPFFNSDFPPYDENQYISASATNWAALALLNALPDQALMASTP
ncbi:MAG TPA: prenyltransferase/squalene oxidase repeat-containing protein [Puia sp.]|jgi:hypothetical protein